MKLFNVIINGENNFLLATSKEEAKQYFKVFNIDDIILVTHEVAPRIQKMINYYEDNVEYL